MVVFGFGITIKGGAHRMSWLGIVLTSVVALEHFGFMLLEMFLWTKPIGLKTFNQTPEAAAASAALAANQGLYNGFLAAGLVWALVTKRADVAIFFLSCVVVAGVFGAATVKPRIFLVQSVPALLALGALYFLA